VVIDGGEIHDAMWITVSAAIAQHEAGELGMLPPTYVTLKRLLQYDTVSRMLRAERDSACPEVFPVFTSEDGQVMVLFRGDDDYSGDDRGARGARHRAVLKGKRWHYIYRDMDPAIPPLISIENA